MNKYNSSKVGVLYLFATLFNKGIAFLTIPLFTRLLPVSDYGMITTYSAWASILTAIIGMQLNCGIRLSRGKNCSVSIGKDKELSTVFTFTLLIATLMFCIICIGFNFFSLKMNFIIVSLCFFEALFTALITDYTYFQMMEYKYIGRTILMISPNLSASILSVILIYFMKTQKYMGRIISLSGCHILIGIVICALVYRNNNPIIEKQYIKWALKLSLPLIIHGIALNILSQADRTMITIIRNSTETGIYSLVYSFSMVATVITTGLEGVWVPWFTEKMNSKNYGDINIISRDYIHLMTYALVALILISPEVIKILSPSSYWKGMVLIPPLIISNFIIFAYTMYVNVEYYYEKTLFITVNTIIAAIINVMLNAIFIPEFGYTAAAYTTLASYVCSLGLHARYANKMNNNILPFAQYIVPIIHLTVISIIFYFLMDIWIIRWSILVLYIMTMVFFERKRIGILIPMFSDKFKFFR